MYINTEQNDADLQLILLILLKHKIQKSFRRDLVYLLPSWVSLETEYH